MIFIVVISVISSTFSIENAVEAAAPITAKSVIAAGGSGIEVGAGSGVEVGDRTRPAPSPSPSLSPGIEASFSVPSLSASRPVQQQQPAATIVSGGGGGDNNAFTYLERETGKNIHY